jgi:hypothetical protein
VTRSLILKDTHPPKDFTSITQAGLKALNLGLTHKAEIDPRLPGITDSLSADLDALGAVVPGAVQARHEAQVATRTQNAVLGQGYARVRAIRLTVRKSGVKKEVQRAYGVGQTTKSHVVRDVKAALQQIVDRAIKAPEEAAAFGLAPAAVDALQAFLEAFMDANRTQERKRANVPQSTKERNLTANRVLQSAVLIAGAGMLAFADDPVTFASFEALMASTKRTRAPKAKNPPDAPKDLETQASPANPGLTATPGAARASAGVTAGPSQATLCPPHDRNE